MQGPIFASVGLAKKIEERMKNRAVTAENLISDINQICFRNQIFRNAIDR